MLYRCLGVLAGGYALGFCPSLPDPDLGWSAVLLAAVLYSRPRFRIAACVVAGFTTMWSAAWQTIDERLDSRFAGQTIALQVTIEDFPVMRDGSLRLLVEQRERSDLPDRLLLGWYAPPTRPGLGEHWSLRVRLREPHGYMNPGGFDYEGYLFRERIGATGYVVDHASNRQLPARPPGRLAMLRRQAVARIGALLPADDAAAVLLAIGVGARQGITAEQWERYAVTGTSHLMAISGLHIGLAAGGVLALAWGLLALCMPRGNVRSIALTFALVAAGSYVALSGFAVPARRAFLMTMVAAVCVLTRRRPDPAVLLSFPCLVLFFADPVSILTPGFKLSFAAVAVILWTLQQYAPVSPADGGWRAGNGAATLRRLLLLQWQLLVGLFPLTVLLFDRFAVLAPLTNLLVLPVFNFISVPFCLLGLLLSGPLAAIGDPLLVIAHGSIRAVLGLIGWLAEWPGIRFEIAAMTGPEVLLALVPAAVGLLPHGWPGRWLGAVALVAVLALRPAATPGDCLDYHVLDVGQGLAIVIRAGPHTLLFDTGPAFRSGATSASLAIEPFLHAHGIDRLDMLVVSHADQDHAGGAAAIANAFPVRTVLVGEFIPALDRPQYRCNDTMAFAFGASHVRFLHPAGNRSWAGNDASCVMEIATGAHRILLTGDIEKPVELTLQRAGVLRPADVVIVPHHGSATSSSDAFVQAVTPEIAIVSSGFANRWGFPKTEVRRRWERAGAGLLNTATDGAVSQRICAGSGAGELRRERRVSRRYWHHQGPEGG